MKRTNTNLGSGFPLFVFLFLCLWNLERSKGVINPNVRAQKTVFLYVNSPSHRKFPNGDFFVKITYSMTIFQSMVDIDADDISSSAMSSLSQQSCDTHSPGHRHLAHPLPNAPCTCFAHVSLTLIAAQFHGCPIFRFNLCYLPVQIVVLRDYSSLFIPLYVIFLCNCCCTSGLVARLCL
jgi:hypothetical protein